MAGMCSLRPGDVEARLRHKEVAKLAWWELLLEATASTDSRSVSASVPYPR